MTRGSPAVVIVPKLEAPSTAFGLPNGGVLRRLTASARNSTSGPTEIGIRRLSARSTFLYDGPRTGFRDAVPSVKGPACWNAAVLNHRDVERSSDGNSGSPTRFGRCVP